LPYMPFKEKLYDEYSNFWFGATFAPNQWMFNKIVTKRNIEKLNFNIFICFMSISTSNY